MNIENAVSQLRQFASRPALSKAEHLEAQKTMIFLKKSGMSNFEISKACDGRWSESTVKGYTKGVRAEDPNPWQDVTSLLNNLLAAGLTLDRVAIALNIFDDLERHDVNLDNVIDLLLAADSSSLEITDLIKQYELFGESGLSPKNVSEALSLREEVEKKGLGLDSLVSLVELAKNYGEPQKIIEALSHYNSLVELDRHITTAKEEFDSLNNELVGTRQQVEVAKAQLYQLKEPIEAYEEAANLGFGMAELTKLSALAQKHGTVKKLMDAVAIYHTYSDIDNKVDKAKADLANFKATVAKLQTDYAHLKTGVTMCQTMIKEYNLGLDAIGTILSTAKKYGEPIEVLKALECYGKLKVLQQELARLKGRVTERKALLAQIEGKYQEMLEELESLNAVALKVGAAVGSVENQLENSKDLQKLVNLIKNPTSVDYDGYGPLVLVVATSLRKWVFNYEHKFKLSYSIKNGLENLISELGGK